MRKLSARLCVSRLYGSFGAVKTKSGLLGLDLETAERLLAVTNYSIIQGDSTPRGLWMNTLFDIVPETFFSLLAAPNRRLYARALMVVRDCYRREMKFVRSDLVSYFLNDLQPDLLQQVEQEDDAGELRNLSDRAHLLVRRLIETGWLVTDVDDQTLEETILIPDYAAQVLATLYQIENPSAPTYNTSVYAAYSALRTADAERNELVAQGLEAAQGHIESLQDNLRMLMHNLRQFYKDVHQFTEVPQVLTQHFDQYLEELGTKIYHPLKTSDSFYRFQAPMRAILQNWLRDLGMQELLVQSVQRHDQSQTPESARSEVLSRLYGLSENLEQVDRFLQEIDRRNAAYTRSATARVRYLLNTNRDLKGELIELMKALPALGEEASEDFDDVLDIAVTRVRYADPERLYREPRSRQEKASQPLSKRHPLADQALAKEVFELMQQRQSLYADQALVRFLDSQRPAGSDRVGASELNLGSVEDFLRTLLATVKSDELEFLYQVQGPDGTAGVQRGQYRIPDMTFILKDPTRTSVDDEGKQVAVNGVE